jgi:hypothetical protein
MFKFGSEGQVSDISDAGGELNLRPSFGKALENGKSRIVSLRALNFKKLVQERSGNSVEKSGNTT